MPHTCSLPLSNTHSLTHSLDQSKPHQSLTSVWTPNCKHQTHVRANTYNPPHTHTPPAHARASFPAPLESSSRVAAINVIFTSEKESAHTRARQRRKRREGWTGGAKALGECRNVFLFCCCLMCSVCTRAFACTNLCVHAIKHAQHTRTYTRTQLSYAHIAEPESLCA